MKNRRTPGGAVKLAVFFVLVAAAPLAALAWLGWHATGLDRANESAQLQIRLDTAAALTAREIDRTLSAWETPIHAGGTDGQDTVPSAGVLLSFDRTGVVRTYGVRLPYVPAVAGISGAQAQRFADGEALEFRGQGSLSAAEQVYRQLATSSDRSVRAGALMRLGRCLRKEQRLDDAIAAFRELLEMDDVPVADDAPAALVARRQLMLLYETTRNEQSRARERDALSSDLVTGRFRIERSTFDMYGQLLTGVQPPKEALMLADAVIDFWPRWQERSTGRGTWGTNVSTALAIAWQHRDPQSIAVVAPVDTLVEAIRPTLQKLKVDLALEDDAGQVMWGSLAPDAVAVTRSARDTGLPWTIRVAASDWAAIERARRVRQQLLAGGFLLIVLVIGAASYVVFRSVGRELAVARLQSDFVSTVSHEFRTPLAAMRHLSEMLEGGSVESSRLGEYYRALSKETRRLHSLVENLLDFGRMESGQREYQMEQTDAYALAEHTLEEFRDRASASGHRLTCAGAPCPGRVRADREAFGLALRNLLDNAVKYSPSASTVTLSFERADGEIGVAVADQGLGIAPAEQATVWRKFVRGSAARALHVKGTGLGLAMVERIVEAHGGRLELVSNVGKGSRFTIWLPEQS